MIKSAMYVASFALLTVLSLPVLAQDAPAKATVATIQVDSGVVMVSDGGAFATATSGEQVAAGSRLMVSKDSAASVVYSDGCKRSYTKAGVYPIDAQCNPAVAVASVNQAAQVVATVVAVTGVAGVAYGVYCKNDGSNCSGSAPSH